MKPIFLTGRKVLLRTLNKNDLKGRYLIWLNSGEVCRYNTHHRYPFTFLGAAEYLKKVSNSTKELVLAIVYKSKKQHIGNIALQNINYVDRSAEISILLGEKTFWGKGLAKEAMRLLITHAFLSLNLHRLACGTSSANLPMQKLALSLGMKPEGRRRQALYKNGLYQDIIEYGLLAEEFK